MHRKKRKADFKSQSEEIKLPIDYKTRSETGLTTKMYQRRFLPEKLILETAFTKSARNQGNALFPDDFVPQ